MIRDAIESDLEAIVAIYNASIPGLMATADTEPVSVESRRRWLQDRDYMHYPVWVSEQRDGIVGWLSFSRFYGRPAYAATAEISIYVNPALRRAGIATELMDHALSQGPRLGLATFLGFVFAHNEPSVALSRKFGFEQWGRLPRVATLEGIERDVLIMGRRVD